jgi:two-component system sensor histidine kinase YesM
MMVRGGWVCIKALKTEEGIRLEVRDNGTGMTEEQIQNVYNELYESNSSNTHIGIRNIYNRLQLFYHSGVQFEMENMNPGLKIVISLPREEK